jgi:hypothetical protein
MFHRQPKGKIRAAKVQRNAKGKFVKAGQPEELFSIQPGVQPGVQPKVQPKVQPGSQSECAKKHPAYI